jgi:hypothetical protein
VLSKKVVGEITVFEGDVLVINADGEQSFAKTGDLILEGESVYAIGSNSRIVIQTYNTGLAEIDGYVLVSNGDVAKFDVSLFENTFQLIIDSDEQSPVNIGSQPPLEFINLISQTVPNAGADIPAASGILSQSIINIERSGNEKLPDSGFETSALNTSPLFVSQEEVALLPVAAVDEMVITLEDQSVTINVLANDTGGLGSAVIVSGTTLNGGTVVVDANNNIIYTPPANFNGLDSINYTLLSPSGLSDTAVVSINVLSVNDEPSGTDNTLTIVEDIPHTFSVSDFGFSDVIDSNDLANIIIDTLPNPAGGTLTLNGNPVTVGQSIAEADIVNLVFTPAANANGVGLADFTFRVQDDGGTANGGIDIDSVAKVITFDVTPDVEILSQPALISVADNSESATGLLMNFYDGNSGSPTIDLAPSGSVAAALEGLLGAPASESSRLTAGIGEGVVTNNHESLEPLGGDDLYTLTGLIYLESGHTYEFAGGRDDVLHIELGGQVMVTTSGNSFGHFNTNISDVSGTNPSSVTWSSFTAPADGYYTLEAYIGNVFGAGNNIILNLSDNGLLQELSVDNYELYTGTQDLIDLGLHFGEFQSNENVSVVASDLTNNLAGNNNTNVTATTLNVNTDGGYFSAIGSADVVGVGVVSSAISLANLSVASQGTDTVSSVTVGGIPVGAILSDGTNSFTATLASSSVNIVNWALNSLTIDLGAVSPTPVAGSTESLDITVVTTSTTNDSTTTSQSVNVGILSDTFFRDISNGAEVDADISAASIDDGDDNLLLGSGQSDTLVADTQAGVILHGFSGDDTLIGADNDSSDDSLNGNNTLFGGDGQDTITGGSGEDFIVGGTGSDMLRGGFASGAADADTDTFVWQLGDQGLGADNSNLETDIVVDFVASSTASGGDILDFSQLLLGETSATINNYISLSEAGGNTTLSIDVEGDGSGTDLTVQLNGVTGTSIDTLMSNGNIAFDTGEIILRGSDTVGDIINGSTADETIIDNGATSSASSLRGNGGNDTFKFESDDVYTNHLIRMRDFEYGTGAEADILDLSDILVGATAANIDNYINIQFNSFGFTDTLEIYVNGDAPADAAGSFNLELEMHGIDLNAISNTAGFANGAAAYNALDETNILNQLIADGNLII